MTKLKSNIFAGIITFVVAAVGFYFTLPALSIHNSELLLDIFILSLVYALCMSKIMF